MPNGTIVRNVPRGTTKSELIQKLHKAGYDTTSLMRPRQMPPLAPDFPLIFHGDSCTDDCSGHEAGYRWAQEQGITDPGDCGGNSQSFEEGCRAYAEEQ